MADFEIKPALCLDLDGTIRYSLSGNKFISGPDDIGVYSGVEQKLWDYKDAGCLVFGITNQGGVAYGYKTVEQVDNENLETAKLFSINPFDKIIACVFHENGNIPPYNYRSLMRKPNIGMLVQIELSLARESIIVDWDSSLLVGDRPEDEQCAKNAGISFVWADQFFENVPELIIPRCTNCQVYLGYKAMAGLAIQVEDNQFCDEYCLEQWYSI